MLTFAEELLLLALDEEKGTIKAMPPQALKFALAGALLMELALANRIDTDPQALMVIDPEPTGDDLLDETLEKLQPDKPLQPVAFWLGKIAWQSRELQDRVLGQLVDKGVLKVQEHRILWVFPARRYPVMDDMQVQEVRARLRELIEGNAIPDPRDAVLVGLVNACQLFDQVFSEEELARLGPRIAELTRLDLIGREVNHAINDISLVIAQAMPGMM